MSRLVAHSRLGAFSRQLTQSNDYVESGGIRVKSAYEAVARVLENRRETETIEVKRSVEVLNVPYGSDKIEESLVAITNSALGQNGWLIFGIDDDSLELVGMLDLEMKTVVSRETREIRRQQFSQIASRTKPSISFEWMELTYNDKELVVVRIEGRKRGNFFQTSKGAPLYRIGDHTYVADQTQIRRWLEEPELEEQATSPVSTALTIYLILCFVSLPWAALWVLDPSQVLRMGIPISLGLGFVTALAAHLRQWKIADMAKWCRERFAISLLATGSFVPATVMLQLSLSLYPVVSGLYFETHLRDAPSISLYVLLALILGGVVLNLPAMSSITQAKRSIVSWLPNHMKLIKKAALASLIITLAATGIAPLDSYLLLGTPKVGLVESRQVSDGSIHIYEIERLKFGAWAVNQETVHLLLPLVLVVDRVWYPLVGNSTTRKPTIIGSSGLSASLDMDQTGKLRGLWLSISKPPVSSVFVAVSYFSELNVSSVVAITFHKERSIQSFDNGTQQMQQTFEISNISDYALTIGPIWLYPSTSQFEVEKNVTNGRTDISYSEEARLLYLNADLQPDGRIVATVTYNRPASL